MIQRHLYAAALCVAVLCAAAPATALIEVVGETQAALEWEPASGPVLGYLVYVSRNGAEALLVGSVAGTRGNVGGEVGDMVRVTVSAFDATGNEGPRSPMSEGIMFVADTPPNDDPPNDDPPNDDPPNDDPPKDDPPPVGDGIAQLDFDGDGLSDLFLRNGKSEGTRVLKMRGSEVAEAIELPPLPREVAVVGNGDYDGDGLADALCMDPEQGTLEVWLIRGGEVADRRALGEPLGEGFRVRGNADFDGDGQSDTFVRNRDTGQIEVWYMDAGDVAEIVELEDTLGRRWHVRGTGDHDGDGVADVLFQHNNGKLVFWRFGEDGVEQSELGALPRGWKVIGTGDLDGNGTQDLLVSQKRDRSRKTLGAALVGSDGVGDPVAITQVLQTRWRLDATGDYDGDGRMDLVVKDRDSKERSVLFMEGTAAAAVETLPKLGRGWHPAGVSE